MRLTIDQIESRRTIHLTDTGGQEIHVFFESSVSLPNVLVLDGFINAIIFYAMQVGRTLYVDGPVSKEAIYLISAFQEAWSCWRPDKYTRVEVVPTTVLDSQTSATDAIAAYSGGVDSTFTLLRHSKCLLGHASFPIKAALLVHGFDVPLSRVDHFERLKARVRPLLDELKVELVTIKTNIKDAAKQDWQDSFLAQLSACLHNFSHLFKYGVTGSGEPYNALVLPWGQNPCTDYLLSGQQMSIVHDGAAYSRTEKVNTIAEYESAARAIKVCWEGRDTFENCGRCEKCVRTKLNFAAVGVNPKCFVDDLTVDQIKALPPFGRIQKAEFSSILEYSKSRKTDGYWAAPLRTKLRSAKLNLLHCEFAEFISKMSGRLERLSL